jgi:microcystin degradation protein MlrC
VHFRAGFQPIAAEVITCAAPGMNLADPADFTYAKLPPGIRRRPAG